MAFGAGVVGAEVMGGQSKPAFALLLGLQGFRITGGVARPDECVARVTLVAEPRRKAARVQRV